MLLFIKLIYRQNRRTLVHNTQTRKHVTQANMRANTQHEDLAYNVCVQTLILTLVLSKTRTPGSRAL